MTDPFNPLAMGNLGESILNAMLANSPRPLDKLPRKGEIVGAGIYAIYYTGIFPAYELLAERNRDERFEQPIYVGRALPEGVRKGSDANPLIPTSTEKLRERLMEHRRSIRQAENLDIDDFWCRWLVVEPIWIPLGENVLITRTAPVWNRIVDGFGGHDPGGGRHAGEVSRWDALHPGRAFTRNLQPRSADDGPSRIVADVETYLRQRLTS